MCSGSIYYIGRDGTKMSPVFDFKEQLPYLAEVFGNTTFVFIYHHSVSGIITPVRPQKSIKNMFLYSNIIGSLFLVTEAMLAWIAFASLTAPCVIEDLDGVSSTPSQEDKDKFNDTHEFPCKVSGLYNQNFLDLPVLGQICNFYPMLNVAAVPILNITLRNNLLDVVPIKPFIRRKNRCLCLLDDHKNNIKGLWSLILSIPVFLVVCFYRDVQTLVTYTGGFCGSFILLIFPSWLVLYSRRLNPESKYGCENPNKSPFQSNGWPYMSLVWALITISSVVYKIASGGSGE